MHDGPCSRFRTNIDFAKDTGIVNDVDRHVLTKAARELRESPGVDGRRGEAVLADDRAVTRCGVIDLSDEPMC